MATNERIACPKNEDKKPTTRKRLDTKIGGLSIYLYSSTMWGISSITIGSIVKFRGPHGLTIHAWTHKITS